LLKGQFYYIPFHLLAVIEIIPLPVLHKWTIKEIKYEEARKNKEESHIPVRIFGKIYGNTGYVYNPQPGENSLTNKILYSGGVGIDILTIYDFTLKLEWSFNQLGQNGLFLHIRNDF